MTEIEIACYVIREDVLHTFLSMLNSDENKGDVLDSMAYFFSHFPELEFEETETGFIFPWDEVENDD